MSRASEFVRSSDGAVVRLGVVDSIGAFFLPGLWWAGRGAIFAGVLLGVLTLAWWFFLLDIHATLQASRGGRAGWLVGLNWLPCFLSLFLNGPVLRSAWRGKGFVASEASTGGGAGRVWVSIGLCLAVAAFEFYTLQKIF